MRVLLRGRRYFHLTGRSHCAIDVFRSFTSSACMGVRRTAIARPGDVPTDRSLSSGDCETDQPATSCSTYRLYGVMLDTSGSESLGGVP